jgi:hypothetical protein
MPLPAGPPGSDPIRLLVGQQVRATVLAPWSEGSTVIGLLGQRLAAASNVPLEVGGTYELAVVATEPRLVLTPLRSVSSVELAPEALGLSATRLAADLVRFLTADASAPFLPAGADDLLAAVDRFARGEADPADLARLERRLGHDLEARVLRVLTVDSESRSPEAAAALRDTVKARALAFVQADGPSEATRARIDVGRALVEGLGRLEAENARRAEHGGLLAWPIPLLPGSPLRDARLFTGPAEGDRRAPGADDSAERPFAVVLLLDFSALGPVRVDLTVWRDEVQVDFQLVDLGALVLVHGAQDELRRELGQAGLDVGRLSVRRSPGRALPIADLVVPGSPGAGGVVDCHV